MAQSSTKLIKGGNAVTPQGLSTQDVLIRGEQIDRIGDLEQREADLVFDAQGLLVLPGAVDTHVHFNDHFMNTVSVHDYYTGTRAAAYGGVTAVIDFANQERGHPLGSALRNKKGEADGLALVDWGVHPVITDPTPDTIAEIPVLIKEGAPTFKCYMTYRQEGLMTPDEDLKRILRALREAGGMLLVHAEDNDTIEKNVPAMINSGRTKAIFHARSRPVEAENRAIQRCIQMTRETDSRLFIVHMATDMGVDLVSRAQEEGLDVHAETCTHYLIFTDQKLEREDGIKWICSPPLRNISIQDRLWEGIRDGQISLVSSDDAAFSWEAKLLGAERFDRCPNGIPGIESRLSILYSEGVAKGRLSLQRFVELVSTEPALLFGLFPQKGCLVQGADADIVLFDPQKKWVMGESTQHMAADWSAYEGIKITGKIEKVFSRGELIIDGQQCLAQKGRGRYIHRSL
ncbi:MAG: dihydropyrimidinase [Candidatus Aminicenantes bacterium]